VPLKLTVCGLPDASLVILSVALFAPTLVGLNFTEIVQVALAATVVQPFTSSTKFDASLTVTPLTVRGELPIFVAVTLSAVLVSSTRRSPNPSVAGDTCTPGARPVPESGTAVCPVAASWVMASTALLEPELAGVKVRDRAHSAFGSRLVHVLPASTNCPPPPTTAVDEIVSVASPVFFTATVCGVLVVPTKRLVKLTVLGLTLMTGAIP